MAVRAKNVLRVNANVVQSAKAIGDKETEYQIEGERGLKLRVLPDGAATYLFRDTMGAGRHRKHIKFKIGRRDAMSLASATAKADELRKSIAAGIDPRDEVKVVAKSLTLRELFERRVEFDTNRAGSTLADYRKVLERDVFGSLGDKPARTIGPDEIADVLTKIERRSIHSAHRARSALGSTFRWAFKKRLVPGNPCIGMGFTVKSKPRTRLLSNDELCSLWAGMDRADASLSDAVKTVVRLAILTCQRRAEVAGMRMTELSGLDTARPRWLIPGNRMKRKDRDQLVPLSPQAADIIRGALPHAQNGCVFPADMRRVRFGSTPRVPHINPESVSRAMGRLTAIIGLDDAHVHDFRKVSATWMRENGITSDTVDAVLHHAPRTVTGSHYDFSMLEAPVRHAMGLWADHVTAVVSGADHASNVVILQRSLPA
jgi:integrase